MDAHRKFNRYDFTNRKKPRVDNDIKATLSQFNATCLVYNRWVITASQISEHLMRTFGNLACTKLPDLTARLNVAVLEGYLAKVDGEHYKLTDTGISVSGVEQCSERGHMVNLKIKGIRYRCSR